MKTNVIYLDNHASTSIDPEVSKRINLKQLIYANPSSTESILGKNAENLVLHSGKQIAGLVGSLRNEIVLTSGATEGNNLAILGLSRANATARRHLVTSSIEHKAVLEPYKYLRKLLGYRVTILPVDNKGRVNPQDLEAAVSEETLLVSIQAASNEIGTIQDIKTLAEITHSVGAYFHTDAAQAVGKIPVDVTDWDVDLLSLNGHKMYGPKGVGALYIKGGPNSIPIEPLWFGGGQEQGLRSGTVNVPGVVGLGEACRLCQELMPQESIRIAKMRDDFEAKITSAIPDVIINGDLENRLPNNSSLTFIGVDAQALIVRLPQLALSTGSACNSGAPEPSHVLTAIGHSRKDAYSTIRVGLGRFNTPDELDTAADLIVEQVKAIRALGM